MIRARGLLFACALVVAACGGHRAASAGVDGAPASAPASAPAAAISAGFVPAGDWPTFDHDSQRSGAGPANTGITARNLGQLRLRRVQLDGIADSAPIELHGAEADGRRRDVIVVTTTYGRTIALDARTGARLWEFVAPGVDDTPGSLQVTNATPTADPDRHHLYAASPSGVIYKLSVASGAEVWARRITRDAMHEKIASALNVSGPYVVAVTGGYFGDGPPYDGHVVTLDRATGQIAHVWNSECSGRHQLIAASSCAVTDTRGDNAIWGRGGAVIEPGSGKILVATGNGPFDGSSDWGDSVLELTADASRLLQNWTPVNQLALDRTDSDVGSTSPALLPLDHSFRLVLQGGKDGKLHLLELNRLDGTSGGPGRRLGGELQEVSDPGGAQLFSVPAVWSAGRRVFVFVGDGSGTGAYRLVGARHSRLRLAWQDRTPATSPVIGGGLLYAYDEINGQLDVRRPSDGGLLRALPVGAGHWNSPIVIGGRIILPTGSYMSSASTSTLDIYHLPGR